MVPRKGHGRDSVGAIVSVGEASGEVDGERWGPRWGPRSTANR